MAAFSKFYYCDVRPETVAQEQLARHEVRAEAPRVFRANSVALATAYGAAAAGRGFEFLTRLLPRILSQ